MGRPLVECLALGTAQFGLAYGINNTVGQPSTDVVAAILAEAYTKGLHLLDTAAAYGNSETRLGELLENYPPATFQLITKLAAGADTARQLQEARRRLKQPELYGVLFHDFGGQQQHPRAWEALQAAKATGQVRRLGVSLYHPWQAEWLLAQQLPLDLVQVPFNVLDQRFAPLLPELARRGVEVHGRSAFLQGLLLRQPAALPAFFAPLRPKLTQLHQLAAAHGIPISALLLLFAAHAPGISRAVIGVDSVENLRENLAAGQYAAALTSFLPALRNLAETEDTYILPYTWPTR